MSRRVLQLKERASKHLWKECHCINWKSGIVLTKEWQCINGTSGIALTERVALY